MIVYCCADLIFATRIGGTCSAMGISSRPARNADMLRARLDRVDDGKGCDPVSAVMVDLDLDNGPALISLATSHAHAPRVIAFGAHVAVDRLQAARDAGADEVMPRGRFTSELPDLLRRLTQG